MVYLKSMNTKGHVTVTFGIETTEDITYPSTATHHLGGVNSRFSVHDAKHPPCCHFSNAVVWNKCQSLSKHPGSIYKSF